MVNSISCSVSIQNLLDWYTYCLKTKADKSQLISQQNADVELMTAFSWKHCLTVYLTETTDALNKFNQISNSCHRQSEQQIQFQHLSSSTAFQRSFINSKYAKHHRAVREYVSNQREHGDGVYVTAMIFQVISFRWLSQCLPKQLNSKVMQLSVWPTKKKETFLTEKEWSSLKHLNRF